MSHEAALANDDLLDPAAVHDPHAFFTAWRERSPVAWNQRWKGWIVTGYPEILHCLQSTQLTADHVSPFYERQLAEGREELRSTYDVLSRWLLYKDPPAHTRLRKLVKKGFTPSFVEGLRGRVQGLCEDLVERVQGQQQIDVMEAFGYPLPASVMAMVVGVPTEDLAVFRGWADDIATMLLGELTIPDRHDRAKDGFDQFIEYLGRLAADRAADPKGDLISEMIHSEVDGEKLTRDEVVATSILFVLAGYLTTTDMLGNAVLTLLEHPDELAACVADPDRFDVAFEEMLRYESSAKAVMRHVVEDFDLEGQTLRVGERVLLVLSAGDRDPRQFDDPDAFRVGRPNVGRHLGFGQGIHYCLGGPLARVEIPVMLRVLFGRYPDLRLIDEPLEWRPTYMTRGLRRLPVELQG